MKEVIGLLGREFMEVSHGLSEMRKIPKEWCNHHKTRVTYYKDVYMGTGYRAKCIGCGMRSYGTKMLSSKLRGKTFIKQMKEL